MASTEISTGLGTSVTPAAGEPAAEPGPSRVREVATRTGKALNRLFGTLRSNRKASVGFILLVFVSVLAAVPGLIAHDPPRAEIYGRSLRPSAHHLFGTTVYGQDIFSPFIWGARETLIIAVVSGVLSTVLSVIMGVAAAYLGGVADGGLNLITDTLLVIPSFPLLLIIAAYLPNSGVTVLIAILVVTGYSYGARILRAQALSLRRRGGLVGPRGRVVAAAHVIEGVIIPRMTAPAHATLFGPAVG